jgi:predicted dinucleotide-utilizing enzyme
LNDESFGGERVVGDEVVEVEVEKVPQVVVEGEVEVAVPLHPYPLQVVAVVSLPSLQVEDDQSPLPAEPMQDVNKVEVHDPLSTVQSKHD